MTRLILLVAALAFFASTASADIIIFKSGSAREGIIEEETPTSVKLRVRNSVMGFSRSNIERIEYASTQENMKLDRKWLEQERKQEEENERKRAEKRKFEQEQRDKGFVEVGGEWVTREEKVRMRKDRKKQRMERKALQDARKAQRKANRDRGKAGERNASAKNIVVKNVELRHGGGTTPLLRARVMNKGGSLASSISVKAMVYDKQGQLIYVEVTELSDLGPNQSRDIVIPLDIDGQFVGSSKMQVMNVLWQ